MKHPKPRVQINHRKILLVFLGSATVLITVIIWYSRFKLGFIRYFDPDEFLYPNWAYHILLGNIPYIDFMMLVTPLYVLLHSPIFLFAKGIDPLIISRYFSFIITLTLSCSLGFLFFQWRKSWLAILVPLTVSILPMPSDKLLEIRPDALAITLLIIGLIFQYKWHNDNKNTLFFSGLFYALSLLTLQKNLPQIVLAALAILIKSRRDFLRLLSGLAIPVGIFLIWTLAVSSNPRLVIYSITRLPLEHAQMYLGKTQTLYYFLPIITYYGQWGYGWGSIGNHFIWIIGGIIAIFRLKKELLMSSLYLLSIGLYFSSPIIFPQYLIPAACFTVLFFVDGINFLFLKFSKRNTSLILFCLFYLFLLWSLYKIYHSSHQIKFSWTNLEVFANMKEIFAGIPQNEYVLDMEGKTIYYQYPYYLCCLSFEIPQFISYRLPSLKDALLKTKTKYIYQGSIDRINFLMPKDREFVLENYTKSPDNQMFIAKNW